MDLPGGNPQSRRQLRIAYKDASAFGWPIPPRKGDRVVDQGGRTYVVQAVDQLYIRGMIAMYVMDISG